MIWVWIIQVGCFLSIGVLSMLGIVTFGAGLGDLFLSTVLLLAVIINILLFFSLKKKSLIPLLVINLPVVIYYALLLTIWRGPE